MKQIAIVVIDSEGQKPYSLLEKHAQGDYEALRHFFQDIGYKVEQIHLVDVENERTAIGHLQVFLNGVR